MTQKIKFKEYETRITNAQIARAKRKIISENIDGVSFNCYDFEGCVDNVIEKLQDLRHQSFLKGYQNVFLLTNYDSGDVTVSVTGEREETDADVRRRLAAKLKCTEEAALAIREEADKEMQVLKKLASKYDVRLTFTK